MHYQMTMVNYMNSLTGLLYLNYLSKSIQFCFRLLGLTQYHKLGGLHSQNLGFHDSADCE